MHVLGTGLNATGLAFTAGSIAHLFHLMAISWSAYFKAYPTET